MHSANNSFVFRTFSANHWNQSEIIVLKVRSSFLDLNFKNAPIYFSNAEKLRKFEYVDIENIILELSRTNRSNGFTILFPIIHECFNVSSSVQVRS